MRKIILFIAAIALLMTSVFTNTALAQNKKKGDARRSFPDSKTVMVSFLTPDGFQLKGEFFPTRPDAPVVLLLHKLGSTRSEFIGLAKMLQKEGLNALAYDGRGHGESVLKDGRKVTYETFSSKDFADMTVDIDSAIKFLRSQKRIAASTPIGIVGASIQSSTGLVYASGHKDVKAVVMLSPGLDYHGIDTVGPMKLYGNRPVYLAASINDAPSYKAVKELEATSGGTRKKEVLSDGGHGAEMFRKDPGLQDRVAAWLKASLR